MPPIASLLIAYRDRTGDSYDEMARKIDYAIKPARLHQLVRETPRNFPEPRTVEALASLLQVPVATIVLALASSLGIAVEGTSSRLAQIIPPGTDELTPEDREAVVAVIRQLVAARSSIPPEPPEPNFSKPVPGVRLAETEPLRVVTDRDQLR